MEIRHGLISADSHVVLDKDAFASRMSKAEWGHPRVVMEVLGHSDISLTLNTYSHVIPDLQREAATKMDAILAGAKPELVTQTEARVN